MRQPEGPHLKRVGKFWWYEFQVGGHRFHRSTREADHAEAQAKAARAWHEAHQRAGLPVPRRQDARDLTDLVGEYLAELRVHADEKHPQYAATAEQHLPDYVLTVWARLQEVSSTGWDSALREARLRETKYKRRPSWSTLQRVTVSLRRFLAWCFDRGLLEV